MATEEVDFEPEEVEMEEAPTTTTTQKSSKVKTKGRGHTNKMDVDDRYQGRGGVYESVDDGAGGGPAKSVEGYIIFVRGVHEEASVGRSGRVQGWMGWSNVVSR